MAKRIPKTSLPKLRHGAEPFLLEGGDVGAVCVHGFTASPEEMRWMGEYLNERGLTVYGPRMAGHGTSPDMMRRQHWMTWYEDVLDGIALVRARCRKVYMVGLSMGGLLSLRVAAEGLVDGAAILAAPLYVKEPLLPFARWVKYFKRYIFIEMADLDERVRETQRQKGREDYGRVAYDDVRPSAAAAQLYALMQDVKQHLAEVRVPLLLVYSKADATVPLGNMRQVAEGVSSTDVTQIVLERSDHVLTQDVEHELVYQHVWNFISAHMEA